jgi:hypothetical protein
MDDGRAVARIAAFPVVGRGGDQHTAGSTKAGSDTASLHAWILRHLTFDEAMARVVQRSELSARPGSTYCFSRVAKREKRRESKKKQESS